MESCEVLIIGGGPAGATCARQLTRAGFDVLLLDSRRFPRDKPCAGWITPSVLETLEIDREEYGRGRVLQEIR
ncbi:MAG TPA: FAD-dependent oxidoreductase, partial [Geobacteraceae bacterium]|nr:FAD-dependent oxidoreductase [Geobacteraceae bacterium]